MKAAFCEGFAPVFDENSRVLILGSFPSVKSRETGFYYGNPQNKFWRTLGAFFHEEPPKDPEGRRAYVLKHGAALWDVVLSCTIEGSSDASIQGETVADVASLVKGSKIRRILCNWIGNLVENGEYPNDEDALRQLVEDICYNNVAAYFGFKM